MAIIIWVVSAVAALAYAAYKYLTGNGDYWKKLGVESLTDEEELASFWDRITLKVDFLEYDKRCYKRFTGLRYGGLVDFRQPKLYLLDPELIHRILDEDFGHFEDPRIICGNERETNSTKILTNKSGKDLRSTIGHAFTGEAIQRIFTQINTCGNKLADYLGEAENLEDQVEFLDVAGRYVADVVASVVLGIETDAFSNKDSGFRKMLMQERAFTTTRSFLSTVDHLVPPSWGELFGLNVIDTESREFFQKIVEQSVQKRREEGETKGNILHAVLQTREANQLKRKEIHRSDLDKDSLLPSQALDEKNLAKEMDDETIVIAQALSLFLQGFHAIESLLSFTVYELAINPEVQEKLADEVIPAMEESQGVLTYESMEAMTYLDMVISETLRHHPPNSVVERICTEAYQVPDSTLLLPKGVRILIPVNSIHHDRQYYPDPEKFDPENFSTENKAKRNPHTYLPLGQGPRQCIEMNFVLAEAKAALAHIIYNFKIEPGCKTEIPIQISNQSTIKKPANGMWLKFLTRETTSEGFVKL